MSNIVDDLQQDVEQLEEITQKMDESAQNVTQQKKRLNTQEIDSTRLILETSNTIQEATEQSHLAANTAIKLAEQLKARNLELEEHSNNWRQAIRNILRDQQSAKKYFAIMMGSTVAINIITLGALGYFFYFANQKNAQHRGEVLDIIQTENALLSNKLTMQSDQVSTLTEAMSSDLKKLINHAGIKTSQPSITTGNPPTTENPPIAKNTAPLTPDSDSYNTAKTNTTKTESSFVNQPNPVETLTSQYAELKILIEKILAKQTALEKQRLKSTSPEQLKKLNDLNWLIKKQGKMLKNIQKNLANRPAKTTTNTQIQKTLDALKAELNNLTKQQTAIQTQIQTLQTGFKQYTKTPAEIPAYRYKAKPDNIIPP